MCILILFQLLKKPVLESEYRVSLQRKDKQTEAVSKSTHKVYPDSSSKLRVVQSPCQTRDFHYNQS